MHLFDIARDLWLTEVLIWLEPYELKMFRFVCRGANDIVICSEMYQTLVRWYSEWGDCNHDMSWEKWRTSTKKGWWGFVSYYSSLPASAA